MIKEDVNTEGKTIETVLGIVPNLKVTAPVLYVLNSDKQLLQALFRLSQFKEYDIQSVRDVIVSVVRFYETYADILTGNNIDLYQNLIDIRSDLLQTLEAIVVSITYPRHADLIAAIGLVLKGATYKALNVIRNKFYKNKLNTFSLKPPYPQNLYKTETDAFEIVYSNSHSA